MDLDSFFIVPDNCLIVVKGRPGEDAYGLAISPLLNKIGHVDNQTLYRDPLSNTKELVEQLGPVSIYRPGDRCPNFEYSLLFSNKDIGPTSQGMISQLGLLKTPLQKAIGIIRYKPKYNIIETVNHLYGESLLPKSSTANRLILKDILRRNPSEKEPTTFQDLIDYNEAGSGLYMYYLNNRFTITQKELLKIDENGVARRPGVYYNFVCRHAETTYYERKLNNGRNTVNPAITSIRSQPSNVRKLFNRHLNETLRKRKPFVRNSYAGAGTRRRSKSKQN